MKAYSIEYHIRNTEVKRHVNVDAKDLKSAKNKIGKKHKYKDGRMIVIDDYKVIGYF